MSDSASHYHYRLTLINRLATLSPAQLDQVIFALGVDPSLLSSREKPTRERAVELSQWAESLTGCGLEAVEQVLEGVLAGKHSPQYGLPENKPAAKRQDRNEKILIDAVWTEVEDRLRQSLHNAILVRLDMAEDRTQVSRPWDSQLRTADQKPKALPPGTHIAEVFDRRDVGGKLLILGAPGSGKTTTMLDLSAVLIQRANDDPEQSIPVMVSLSSWQNVNQSITDWLIDELKLKYGVSPKLGKNWLKQKMLLPLLDGLDELPPIRQEPVVQAINHWLQSGDGPTRLLVCSRIEEYELYKTKLDLYSAICLEPLTDDQLREYLNSLRRKDLWDSLRQDESLLTLVRTPLLLSVAVLASDSIDPEQWQSKQTTPERMTYLLDAYVERRLHEVIHSREYLPEKQPTAQQSRYWLIWLAKQIKKQSQDEFLIEQIRPDMLTEKNQKRIAGLTAGVISVFFLGSIYGLTYGLIYRLKIGLIVSLVAGLIGGLAGAYPSDDIPESFDISFSRFNRKDFLDTLGGTLLIGVFIGNLLWVFLGSVWLIYGILFSLVGGIILGFIGGFIVDDEFIVELPLEQNQRILSSFKKSFYLLIIEISILAGIKILSLLTLGGLLNGSPFKAVIATIAFFLLWGSVFVTTIACAQHFATRIALYNSGYSPWNYSRFLNYCTERLLLQRVGGRYRFIHKLVQEHFAAMPLK